MCAVLEVLFVGSGSKPLEVAVIVWRFGSSRVGPEFVGSTASRISASDFLKQWVDAPLSALAVTFVLVIFSEINEGARLLTSFFGGTKGGFRNVVVK